MNCRARPILKCDLCNVFETRHIQSLKYHKKTLHSSHSVSCNVCDRRFKDTRALEKHMTCHTGFPCQTCGKRFQTKAHRNRHIARVHERDSESDESVCNISSSPDSHPPVDCPSSSASPMPSSSAATSNLTSTPSHCSAPRPHFHLDDDDDTGSLDPGVGGLPPHDEHHHDQCCAHDGHHHDQCSANDHHDQCNSSFEDITEPGEHESNANLRKFKCKYCKYEGNSKKRLKRHVKRCHPDGPPPLIECEFCPEFKTKHAKNLARHMEKSCPGLKDFCVLDGDTLWEILTEINISNNQAYKMLALLKKKLGIRFFPKYLRKVLSEKLNSYQQYLTVENLCFKDKDGNDCPTSSTLVYVKDLKKALDDAIAGRGIEKPHINIGTDGGAQKEVVIAQIFDLAELDKNDGDEDENDDENGKKKDLMKSLGAKRSLVIARGDFCYESRDNLELIYHKLGLFETMQKFPHWHHIGDCKVQNTCAGILI